MNLSRQGVFSFRMEIDETSCFYFCDHFYKGFKKNVKVKGASVLKWGLTGEVIGCWSDCRKKIVIIYVTPIHYLIIFFWGKETFNPVFSYVLCHRKKLCCKYCCRWLWVNYTFITFHLKMCQSFFFTTFVFWKVAFLEKQFLFFSSKGSELRKFFIWKIFKKSWRHLLTWYNQHKCENFLRDTDKHFKEAKIISFDIIHWGARGEIVPK